MINKNIGFFINILNDVNIILSINNNRYTCVDINLYVLLFLI